MIRIFMGICVAFSLTYAQACDICGCAASSFSMGLLPNSQHHFVGWRTSLRSFESSQLHGTSLQSRELFTSHELYGRYKLGKRFQLLAFLPYVYNTKKDSVENVRIQGLGDATLMGNFVFIQTTDSLSYKFKQSGTVGFGIKTPTGQYFKSGFQEINMLPGTGSFDFIFNLNYSIQYRSFGLQNETSFTYKTENKYLYKFGNAFSTSQLLFYRWNVTSDLKIIPQIGLNYGHNWKDRKNGFVSEDTFNGGNILSGQANVFVLYRNWGVSSQFYLPITQNLNSGYVQQKSMLRLSITYFITKKMKHKSD